MRCNGIVSSLTGVLAFTLIAAGQASPTQAPAAQPAPAGAVELAGEPTDDPAARQLVTEAAAAIAKMVPVSFTAGAAMTGGPISMNGQASVVFVRNAAVPGDSLLFAKGRMEMPALSTPDFHVSRYNDPAKGRRVAWQDDAAKIVYDRPDGPAPDGKEIEGVRQAGVVLRSVLMPLLISSTPLSDELKVSTAGENQIKFACVFLPDEKIGEETCKVVRIYLKKGSTERTLWISPTDKLPRKYEQMRSGLARHWTITDLKPAAAEDLRLKNPDGYKFDTSDAGGVPKAAVNPGTPVQPVAPQMGGPAVGQIAPDFDLKSVAGPNVSLASLKGQTVVVTFVGTRFPRSWASHAAAAKAAEGKNAKVLALACREGDDAAAAKAFNDAGGTGQLLLGADAVAGLYQVRGFPSTCVIGPDGKVIAFFEGDASDTQIAAALTAK